MTWDQWLAIVWLRWRLTVNQFRRGGFLNALVLTLVVAPLTAAGLALSILGVWYGRFILPDIYPEQRVLLWGSIVLSFLFLWTTRFVAELQRSELISLDRLLHLPLTLKEMFVLNYVSSLGSLPIVLFLPGTIGLAIGSVVGLGPRMLLLFPLLCGFLLMVTAVTYQLQGWLATLMVNKRRRRAIITFVTAAFLLLAQAPLMIGQALSRTNRQSPVTAVPAEQPIERATRLLGSRQHVSAARLVCVRGHCGGRIANAAGTAGGSRHVDHRHCEPVAELPHDDSVLSGRVSTSRAGSRPIGT